MIEHKHTNALINETSPYLLQHAHNPVQWYAWGPEALAKAKAEDKPILLSIGYSACHWCHVMEHESFEDEEIAKLMNTSFVNIKVDREERPDLDAIYMTAVQLMTGSGGWPMTVFLTPDQAPFFCGTYFPKEDRYGMPGFRRILISIGQTYREKKQLLYDNAGDIVEELRKSIPAAAPQGNLEAGILERAAAALVEGYDSKNGGFGAAPKFPPSMTLDFLMRTASRDGGGRYLEIINKTLTKMACGGIYDQIGGGFHRYSVDAQWLVPHFEKMLYDNALLSRAYLDGYLLTRSDFYRKICQEILDYVALEMTSPEGGFYSSQDADSEGGEGAFFIWTHQEIRALLGEEDAALFCHHYGVSPGGNFEGKNILHVPLGTEEIDRQTDIPEGRFGEILQRSKQKLLDARKSRPKPGRDEKALTAWNGLMMRSFAEASNGLMRDDYRQIAVKNAEFLLSALRPEGKLLRSYKDGRARFNAYLEDYACLIEGLLSLYEATFDLHWMREARELAGLMIERFWDPNSKGFFFTSDDHEPLIYRPIDFYDNAAPSGNSVAAYALLKLWRFTGETQWSQYATAIFESKAGLIEQHPAAFSYLLCALDFFLGKTREIAIIGSPGSKSTDELVYEVFRQYLPNKVVACGMNGGLALLEDKHQVQGRATAYVCENYECKQPVTTPEELRNRLL
jgi:uncharacterized protein YyaL (SSP411 family)